MKKQKNIIELLIYLILLIVGIVFLLKGYHKKDFDIFPNKSPTPEATNETHIPNVDITYDYAFIGDE